MDVALGSPMYMSPELTCEEDYDERVDTWSTGVLTYILLCGVPPFYDQDGDREEMERQIVLSDPPFPAELFKDVSKEAIDFIKKCLVKKQD